MEHTSCGSECPFVKQGFCKHERECPNYIESWWVEGEKSEPKILKDCSPKRMLIQQQHMQQRLEGVQQALEQSRNEYKELLTYLKILIEKAKTAVIGSQEKKQIPSRSENEESIDVIYPDNVVS